MGWCIVLTSDWPSIPFTPCRIIFAWGSWLRTPRLPHIETGGHHWHIANLDGSEMVSNRKLQDLALHFGLFAYSLTTRNSNVWLSNKWNSKSREVAGNQVKVVYPNEVFWFGWLQLFLELEHWNVDQADRYPLIMVLLATSLNDSMR